MYWSGKQKGFCTLKQIAEYRNRLTERDIQDSILLLRGVLNADIPFYKIINGKRCRMANGKYERVK